MDALILNLRFLLFAVFFIAAVGKFADLRGSSTAMESFGVPKKLSPALGLLLPLLEMVLALSMLSVSVSWLGAVLSLLLFAAFIAGMVWQLSKGKAPECHCFGAIHSEPIGKASLVRNVVFALCSLALVFRGKSAQGLSLSELSGDLLVTTVIQLATISVLLILLMNAKRTIKALERGLGIERVEERENTGHPADALPIGAPVPAFEVPNAAGRIVTFEDLMLRSAPLVLFFVGPNCAPCAALLPEMLEWKKEFAGRLDLVLVTTGGVDENIAKFEGFPPEDILIQKNRELSKKFRANWTPAAVLISADRIASRVAVGDRRIRDLFDGIRTRDLASEFPFVPLNTEARVRIGETVSSFSVTDTDGQNIDETKLRGKDSLILFWSKGCGHCESMAAEVATLDLALQVIVFADGLKEAFDSVRNRVSIVQDEGFAVASMKFGAKGAPSAVLVDSDGRIASETAIGTDAIWALIGRS